MKENGENFCMITQNQEVNLGCNGCVTGPVCSNYDILIKERIKSQTANFHKANRLLKSEREFPEEQGKEIYKWE